MRFQLSLACFVGLAVAAPSDLKALKRDLNCTPQPAGAGPVPAPDTAEEFLTGPVPANLALGLATPNGYTPAFTSQKGSVSGPNYQGYSMLSSFDPAQCAAQCDQNANCVGFNIFMERAPSVDPDSTNCPDPASYTYYKCTLWGSPVSQAQATNDGQYRGNFHVVITASYGFNKQTSSTQSGTAGPWTYKLAGNTQIFYHQRTLDFTFDGTSPAPSANVFGTFTNLDPNPQYYYALNAVYRFDAGAANCKLSFFDQPQPSSSQTNNFFLWMRGRSANITVTCPNGASTGNLHMEQLDVYKYGGGSGLVQVYSP